ncbi:MAG: hypothetical protein AAF791_05470 [Bacteroidota bacterium]
MPTRSTLAALVIGLLVGGLVVWLWPSAPEPTPAERAEAGLIAIATEQVAVADSARLGAEAETARLLALLEDQAAQLDRLTREIDRLPEIARTEALRAALAVRFEPVPASSLSADSAAVVTPDSAWWAACDAYATSVGLPLCSTP